MWKKLGGYIRLIMTYLNNNIQVEYAKIRRENLNDLKQQHSTGEKEHGSGQPERTGKKYN